MGSPSSQRQTSVASYVILGLLANWGPQTTYELKGFIEGSIGYFWPFPHSQMYAETRRLEQQTLIVARTEPGGRRRKVLEITDAGRDHLEQWRASPVDEPTQIRDVGLVKLFLSRPDDACEIHDLADRQVEIHQKILENYLELEAGFDDPMLPHLQTIQLGISFERTAIAFWQNAAEGAES